MSIITEEILQKYRTLIEKKTKSRILVLDVFMLYNYNNIVSAYANALAPELYHESILYSFLDKYGSMGLINKNKNKDAIYGTAVTSRHYDIDLLFKSQGAKGIGKYGSFEDFIEILEEIGFGQHCFWKHNSNTEAGATVNASVLLIFETPVDNELEKLQINEIMHDIFGREIMKYVIKEFISQSHTFHHGFFIHDIKNMMATYINTPLNTLLKLVTDKTQRDIIENINKKIRKFIDDSTDALKPIKDSNFVEIGNGNLFNSTKKAAEDRKIKLVYSPSYQLLEKDKDVKIKMPISYFETTVLNRNFIENAEKQFLKKKKDIDEIRTNLYLEDKYIGLIYFNWIVKRERVIISFTTVGTRISNELLAALGYSRVSASTRDEESTGHGLYFLNQRLKEMGALEMETNESGLTRYFKPEQIITEEFTGVSMSVSFPIYTRQI